MTAATRPASSSPIWRWRWNAMTSGRKCASSSPGCSAHRLQPRQPVAQLADLDRSFDDARVERRIVVPQALQRTGALDPAIDPREQHFEVERFDDHIVGAGFIRPDSVAGLRLA